MSHLWQRQGRPAEPRQLLAEIGGRFTAGLDAADLQEASVLLRDVALN